MLDKLVEILMLVEAMNAKNIIQAYLFACGGGILRSALLFQWSGNFKLTTIIPVVAAYYFSAIAIKTPFLRHWGKSIRPFKAVMAEISTVIFGIYGLLQAPTLGPVAYILTSCGGGLWLAIASGNSMRSILKGKILIACEGIVCSAFMEYPRMLLAIAIALIGLRIVYQNVRGRDTLLFWGVLNSFRGKVVFLGLNLHRSFLDKHIEKSVKAVRTTLCSLCRRRTSRNYV